MEVEKQIRDKYRKKLEQIVNTQNYAYECS